jgi:putative membrane protein
MQLLDPKAFWLFFIKGTLFMFPVFLLTVPVFAVGMLDNKDPYLSASAVLGIILALIVCSLILTAIWAKLTYAFYKYELVDEGFRKEQGIIWKKYVTIPYDRIQNVDIYRGLVARLLGLSDLQIQTAGGSYSGFSEGRLPGLSRVVAEQLRSEVLRRRIPHSKNQGL